MITAQPWPPSVTASSVMLPPYSEGVHAEKCVPTSLQEMRQPYEMAASENGRSKVQLPRL